MTTTTFDEGVSAATSASEGSDRSRPGWAASLVANDSGAGPAELVRRAAMGLGLSALYGVALGARHGGRALFVHAIGAPLGLLLVVLLGAPSMFVFLSLSRAPIDGRALLSTTARGVSNAGVMLAGLAPAAALFVVSSETEAAARGAVVFGLLLGGGVALTRTVWEVFTGAFRGRAGSVLGGTLVAAGFAVFATALAVRVWTSVLPILGGAS